MEKQRLYGHLGALFTIIMWGTTFIATKILLEDFLPVEIMFIRFLIGLGTLSLLRPQVLRLQSRKQEIPYALAGLTGITLYFILENTALLYTLSTNVSIIVATIPFFTGLLSLLIYRDTSILRWQFFAGFLLALSGIVLITLNGQELHLNPLGDLLAIGAALCWAVYSLLMKKIHTYGFDTIQNTKRIFLWGVILTIPVCAFSNFEIGWTEILSLRSILLFLFLGVGASAVGYLLWNYAVKMLGPIKTNLYIYLNPVSTLVASLLILHEPLTGKAAVGIGLILGGLLISEIR